MEQLNNIRKCSLPADDECAARGNNKDEKKFQAMAHDFAALEMIEAQNRAKKKRIPYNLMGKWLRFLHGHGLANAAHNTLNKAIEKRRSLELFRSHFQPYQQCKLLHQLVIFQLQSPFILR